MPILPRGFASPEDLEKISTELGKVLTDADVEDLFARSTGDSLYNHAFERDTRKDKIKKAIDWQARWFLTFVLVNLKDRPREIAAKEKLREIAAKEWLREIAAKERLRELIVKGYPDTLKRLTPAADHVKSAMDYLQLVLHPPFDPPPKKFWLRRKEPGLSQIQQSIVRLFVYKMLHERLLKLLVNLHCAQSLLVRDVDPNLVLIAEQAEKIAKELAEKKNDAPTELTLLGDAATAEKIWVDALPHHVADLRAAATTDAKEEAISDAEGMVRTQLERLNDIIFEAVKELSFDELTREFPEEVEDTAECKLLAEAVRDLRTTVLARTLKHSLWQEIEKSISVFNGYLERSEPTPQIADEWFKLRYRVDWLAKLEPDEPWADEVQECAADIDHEIYRGQELNEEDVRMHFDEFLTWFRKPFQKIDDTFRIDCSSLRELDDPLKRILEGLRMIDDAMNTSATDQGGGDRDSPYENLAALRDAHLALRRSVAELASSNWWEAPSTANDIRTLLTRARRTGTILRTAKDRRSAQAILDYWSAELAASPGAGDSDLTVVILEKFQEEQPSGGGGATVSKAEQQEFIRFSAAARQWQVSGELPGYLLDGEPFEQAKKSSGRDPNLDRFIDACEEAIRKKAERAKEAKKRQILILCVVGSTLFVAGSLLTYYLLSYLPGERDAWSLVIKNSKADSVEKQKALGKLALWQRFLPPYDLSGGNVTLTDISLPNPLSIFPRGFTESLYAVNFVGAKISGANFERASLERAIFSNTTIQPSLKQPSKFDRSRLQYVQFKEARIEGASFVGADLYRAMFDRSYLCDVDFSEADLRSTSFWAVTLNETTIDNLKGTAWWLAKGWGSHQVRELLKPPARPTSKPVKPLRESIGFTKELEIINRSIARSSAASIERALAYSDLAWTAAIWGIATLQDGTDDDRNKPRELPRTALEAVEQAIDIVKKDDAFSRVFLANFQDTKAYLLMQQATSDRSLYREAVKLYRTNEMESLRATGEILFRYAVARYNAGEVAEGMKDLETAVREKKYLPTHEIKHLDIPPPFLELISTLTNIRWPSIQSPTCEELKDAPQ